MYGILKREISSATEFSNSNDGNGKYTPPAFGYPNTNHGWVKCASKTFPGQNYYFNIDSACSTWIRPVSRFAPTPLVRPQNHIQDDDYWDPTPIGVSDIEDEDEDDYNDNCEIKIEKSAKEEEDVKPAKLSKKEERQKKIYNDVLFKLYHCYGDQWNVEETEDVKPFVGISLPYDCDGFEDDMSEDCEIFLPEATYSSDSEGETTESLNKTFHNNSMLSDSFGSLCESHSWGRKSPESYVSSRRDDGCNSSGTFKTPNMMIVNRWKSPKKIVTPRKNFSKEDIGFENQNDREKFDYQLLNYLDSRNINDSDDSDDLDTLKEDNSFADDTLNAEACRDLELSFDGEDDNDESNHGNWEDKNLFGLPKLKAIEFSDLLTDPFRNRKKNRKRKRTASKKVEEIHKSPPKTVIKTVVTLNGVTTVNYDYLSPQLPDGVVMTNLSDSGSSACYDAWQALRNNDNTAKNSSFNATNETVKPFHITHDLLNFADPCLSDSSTSSERSVGSKKPEVKKQLESKNISEDSESDSSDSSSSSSCSSSGGSTSSKNTTDKRIRKISRIAKKDVNKDSDLDLSSNSDKTWIAGSEDEED